MHFSDYLKLQKDYEEQKRLEAYQLSRPLPVPKTTKLHAVLWTLLLVLLVAAVVLLCVWLIDGIVLRVCVLAVGLLVLLEFYLRFLGIKLVECYQHYTDAEVRRRCLCIPSCSEYAIACLKKYELIRALRRIRRRLYVTCRGDEYKLDPP